MYKSENTHLLSIPIKTIEVCWKLWGQENLRKVDRRIWRRLRWAGELDHMGRIERMGLRAAKINLQKKKDKTCTWPECSKITADLWRGCDLAEKEMEEKVEEEGNRGRQEGSEWTLLTLISGVLLVLEKKMKQIHTYSHHTDLGIDLSYQLRERERLNTVQAKQAFCCT